LAYALGARPVLYASDQEIGRKIREGEDGWQADKEIYTGALPQDLQYLWVKYDPSAIGPFGYALDFAWEREWRLKFPRAAFPHGGLPVGLHDPCTELRCAVLVAAENEIPVICSCLSRLRANGALWTANIGKVISFERARSKLAQGDQRYARLETWPTED
jgi:hypothetical protein